MKSFAHAYITFGLIVGRRQGGQTAAEYGVVLGVIMLGLVATIGLVSDGIEAYFLATADRIGGLLP